MDIPAVCKPIECHGANLRPVEGCADLVGDCPLCGKERHLYVDPETGKWDCKVCGQSGNPVTFLTRLAAVCGKSTSSKKLAELAKMRGIPASVLREYNVSWDGEHWLVPHYSETGTVRDIQRYDGKVMRATAGCKTQLFGARELAAAKEGTTVWLCEGCWDAMAMRWLLDEAGRENDLVCAVPGAGTLKQEWLQLFNSKNVICVYDNDEAGDRGAAKARKMLHGRTRSLQFIQWPFSRPKGYDARDFVRAVMANRGAAVGLRRLLALRSSEPRTGHSHQEADAEPTTVQEADKRSERPTGKPIAFAEVVETFRGCGVLMDADSEAALKVVLATCASVDVGGDPLWVYLVAPPATGKTLLLTSLVRCPACVFRSTLTAHCLVSGWKGGEDPSLIPKLSGRTFVLKDFTEVLAMPQVAQDEIYSTLRGAYDGTVAKTFGNGEHREYGPHTDPPFLGFNMLAGVTHAVHGHDMSSLGERFLKFNMRQHSEAHSRAVHMAALDSIGKESRREGAMQDAVASFLSRKMDPAQLPRLSRGIAERLDAVVRLIATLRSRVARDWRTLDVQYRPSPEAGTRLMKQLGKLAMAMAHVDGKKEVDEETFAEVRRVAFDTAYGFHLDVVEAMMAAGGRSTKAQAAIDTGLPISTLQRRFDDLQLLGIIADTGLKEPTAGGRPASLFEVTKEVSKLWNTQAGQQNSTTAASAKPTASGGRTSKLRRSSATSAMLRKSQPSSSTSVRPIRVR